MAVNWPDIVHHTHNLKKKPWLVLFAVLVALLALAPAAHAHTRGEVGPYALVVGWRVEPPIIGERNAVTVEITADEEPVTGAEGSLDVEVVYAGRTFRANLNPTETPGLYTVELFPTVRGQYEVHLSGTLGETELDEVLEPEEVFPAARIQFPEPEPDVMAMSETIDRLSSQLQTARTIAYVGVAVGVLGLLTAVFSLIRLQVRNGN